MALLDRVQELRIAEGNRHFRVSDRFVLTFDGHCLIRYFADHLDVIQNILMPREIEVISNAAFARKGSGPLNFRATHKL
jgi:hypothetical protein